METLNQILDILSKPIVWVVGGLVLLYYCVIAEIGNMDMPTETSSRAYRKWFRFCNIFAANLKRAATALHIPQADAPDDKEHS